MAVARLAMVSLDCAEPVPLAKFWAALLDGTVIVSDDQVSAVQTDAIMIATIRVPDYRPPTWPGGATPKHIHLDLAVLDLDETEAAALKLGASKADDQPQPDQWRVYLDPAGHPFCLTANIPFTVG
ncbi:MAG: VOC family protein [Actinophytocola sp.]|uniref:VOC family protein n=1 Tax=Actinophytocola sp. TaxID=1872138 RepID=UPI0013293BBF|nr:VOC family protein [Actinophytocola sp.]MPZ82293.1 VOC family protein [Actinophytocola sp.]